MNGSEVVPDLLPRIKAATYAAHDCEDAWRLRIRQRDDLILEASDAGVSQRAIADAAQVSRGRVVAILCASQDLKHVV